MSEVATPGKVTFNTSLSLGDVQRCAIAPGLRVSRYRGDALLYPTAQYINQIAPAIDFQTRDLATALALNTNLFAINGLALSAAFNAYLTQRTADAGLATTGDKVSISNGLILPLRLAVRDTEPATLDCRVIGRSTDGTTAAMAVLADQVVPGAAAIAACHTVGKVSVNGSPLALCQSMDLDFGIEFEVIGGDGLLYPVRVHLTGASPVFRFRLKDADALATMSVTGKAQTGTDSVVSLRKFSANAGRVADATAEHVTFTIDDGLWWVETVEGEHGGDYEVELVCQPIWDASNNIVVVSAAAVIS